VKTFFSDINQVTLCTYISYYQFW